MLFFSLSGYAYTKEYFLSYQHLKVICTATCIEDEISEYYSYCAIPCFPSVCFSPYPQSSLMCMIAVLLGCSPSLIFATEISPFWCEIARVPLCVRQHGRSRHWQHCHTLCKAESDSFAKVIRIFIDCFGRVEQELKKVCFLYGYSWCLCSQLQGEL